MVYFMDGHEEALQANLIAEYMFSNVNEEGHRQLLDGIIDHRNIPSKTLQYADSLITSKNGQQKRKPTTAGVGYPHEVERWFNHLGNTKRMQRILCCAIS